MTKACAAPAQIQDMGDQVDVMELVQLLQRVSHATEPSEIQHEFGLNMRQRTRADAYVSLSLRGLGRHDPQPYRITRVQVGSEVGAPTDAPWDNPEQLPVATGGFLGRLIATPTPKIAHHLNLSGDSVLGDRLHGCGSCIAIPLYDGGEALNWGITFRSDPTGATLGEAAEFLLRGNLIGGLTRAVLVSKQVRQLNTRLTAQLEHIAQIQRSLLPGQLPHIVGLDIATSYLTSDDAGGDYYDFFDMGDDRWGVIVADVSGHGAGAATVMAMLQAILHGFQERGRGPAAMLEHANRQLLVRRVESSFVTAFMGVFDEHRRSLTYANAGHNRPVHRQAVGSVKPIDDGAGLPLGILEDTAYEQEHLTLGLHDTIVLYTDGITEAFSPAQNREMFGTGRLVETLQACSGQPDCVIESIHQRLYEHTRARTRDDDQTIVAIRVEA